MNYPISRLVQVFLCILLLPTVAYTQHVEWDEIAPGIWKGIVGVPEEFDLLVASGATLRLEGLKKMEKSDFPFNTEEIAASVEGGKTFLRFPLAIQEQIYGFGLQFKTVHQRGQILQLHVDHYGGRDDGRTHAPVPFYVSSNGYGVFVNSARYIDVYAGSAVRKNSKNAPRALDRNTDKNWTSRPYSDAVEMLIPAPGIEVYVFAGPTPLDAVRRFNLFNGGGPIPPRWGLGFTQRVHKLYTAEEVLQEASDFEEKGYPLDFIGLEPGWQSKSYPNTFVWDAGRFPKPKEFIRELKEKGVRINLWINPYPSPESPIYKPILPYTSSHTVWAGVVPDFTLDTAQRVFWGHFEKEHLDIGVSGYKIDEVDGFDRYLWPDVAQFPSGISAEQMRQTYGLLVQRQSDSLYRKRNERTYGLVRASNAGATSFPYVIYNDYYNHEDFITALINSGFSGLLWTPEARASQTGEEWLRRMQTVVFSPMAMVNAWSSGTKPWSFEEVAEEVRQLALLRMRMMPYWYSEFAKYHFEGTPPFRAMDLEEGFHTGGEQRSTLADDEVDLEVNPYAEAVKKEVKDQYMAGEYLLIAPIFTGQTSRQVILPLGNWYDFYTGLYVGNGEVITIVPELGLTPVFVKDGGVIPMMEPRLHAPAKGESVNLEIRHYGEKPAVYQLYDDDGESFDYELGHYSWREIRVEYQKNGELKGSISKAEKGKPNSVGNVVWRFMTVKNYGEN
ncbi:alpha-D-xyloside xylohydrolase [Algoriphagus sp. 4150]|uniref:glycoside hydrolase family 31 protein n=1 Tax=Algoriphagus sp. 4150 TaxID=2817756 RepID=UPI0028643559|nr:TIM-barrel domain-containing protein [Algoriphagus sp. 4150]MDR7130222.1 alpha-D-xyloside xylohydrolase [Algoriphagus sp. 4150]